MVHFPAKNTLEKEHKPVCWVFNTPLSAYLELHETEKVVTVDAGPIQQCESIIFRFVYVRTNSKENFRIQDVRIIVNKGGRITKAILATLLRWSACNILEIANVRASRKSNKIETVNLPCVQRYTALCTRTIYRKCGIAMLSVLYCTMHTYHLQSLSIECTHYYRIILVRTSIIQQKCYRCYR